MRVLLVSANREQLPAPVVPLGVLSVAGAVRDAHDVRVVDLCFAADAERELSEAIATHRPEVVGLGLRNLHDNTYGNGEPLFAYYERLARTIRAATRAPLVLGGSAITLQPAELARRLGPDHTVVGEGELAFRDLLASLGRGERPERVVRSSVAQTSFVQLGTKPRRSATGLADLDTLPGPARDLVDPRYFLVEGTDALQTKRGCAFQCTYCDYPDLEGRKVRMRDPEAVADELAARARVPNVSHAFFVDSVFNVPRSHAIAVCDAITRRGSPLPWVCYASPASLDDEVASAMARAGCLGAEIGTDSGTPRVLERLRKPFDIAQVLRVHETFRRHGLADCHTFVLGAEGETEEEAAETLAFVDTLDPDVAVFVVFMEDREDHDARGAEHRERILALLAREAPGRPGWVVPELGVRFGAKLRRVVEHHHLRGPAWVHLARARREVPSLSVPARMI